MGCVFGHLVDMKHGRMGICVDCELDSAAIELQQDANPPLPLSAEELDQERARAAEGAW